MQSNIYFPIVTIVSPCFNHELYVIKSLDSIRNQTYQNIEHIIIDDCSTDNSVNKIEEWIKMHNYKCTLIKHTLNKGISATLNESINICKGKYWSTLATDDIAEPDRTKEFINFFIKNPQRNVICSDCILIDNESKLIKKNGTHSFFKYHSGFRKSSIPKKEFGTFGSLLEANYIPSSYMIKKEVLKKNGLYDTTLKMEDWDMWLRLSSLDQIAYIERPLSRYRLHISNTAGSPKFIESYKNEAFLVLYKTKSYCFDKQMLRKVDNSIAAHIFLHLSMKQLILKKEIFKGHNDLILYYKIIFLFYPNKLKLFIYLQYARLSNIKKIIGSPEIISLIKLFFCQ